MERLVDSDLPIATWTLVIFSERKDGHIKRHTVIGKESTAARPIKDRSTSTSDEPMEEKDRSVAEAMASDYLGTTWKPPQNASRSVPDSFAPPMFGGSNIDADSWDLG